MDKQIKIFVYKDYGESPIATIFMPVIPRVGERISCPTGRRTDEGSRLYDGFQVTDVTYDFDDDGNKGYPVNFKHVNILIERGDKSKTWIWWQLESLLDEKFSKFSKEKEE